MLNLEIIEPRSFSGNVFDLFDKDWMLLTAGNIQSFNTMTISWGMMGIMWGRPTLITVVRPQRHTRQFLDKNSYCTLSVLAKEHRDIMNYCGKFSGKDHDKIKETGLLPLETDKGNIHFQQSILTFECKKLYKTQFLEDDFFDKTLIQSAYPNKDYHHVYFYEIKRIYKRIL